jgi:hypothetical protein
VFNEIFLGTSLVVAEMRLAGSHIVRDGADNAVLRMAQSEAVFALNCVEMFGCVREKSFPQNFPARRGNRHNRPSTGDAGCISKRPAAYQFHDVATISGVLAAGKEARRSEG